MIFINSGRRGFPSLDCGEKRSFQYLKGLLVTALIVGASWVGVMVAGPLIRGPRLRLLGAASFLFFLLHGTGNYFHLPALWAYSRYLGLLFRNVLVRGRSRAGRLGEGSFGAIAEGWKN